MKRYEQAIFTNMCMIYDDNGNVLVQNRLDSDWGGIAFPGGHIEFGESFTDSVIREVYEETGLNISNLQICGIKDWSQDDGSRYIVILYKTNKFSGEIKSSDEGEVYWIKLNELSKLKLAEGMNAMLRLFLDEYLTEQFFYKDNGEWIEVIK